MQLLLKVCYDSTLHHTPHCWPLHTTQGSPVFSHGHVEDSALLPTAPEVFKLRKLLPQTVEYDFNIHVMDFNPGEHLLVKVWPAGLKRFITLSVLTPECALASTSASRSTETVGPVMSAHLYPLN